MSRVDADREKLEAEIKHLKVKLEEKGASPGSRAPFLRVVCVSLLSCVLWLDYPDAVFGG
mgnify:CR=1 FL=1